MTVVKAVTATAHTLNSFSLEKNITQLFLIAFNFSYINITITNKNSGTLEAYKNFVFVNCNFFLKTLFFAS